VRSQLNCMVWASPRATSEARRAASPRTLPACQARPSTSSGSAVSAGVADDLVERARARAGRRASRGHRLERRPPEALVERGEDEQIDGVVERRQALVGDGAQLDDGVDDLEPLGERAVGAEERAPRAHEARRKAVTAQAVQHAEHARDVLVEGPADVEEQRSLAQVEAPPKGGAAFGVRENGW